MRMAADRPNLTGVDARTGPGRPTVGRPINTVRRGREHGAIGLDYLADDLFSQAKCRLARPAQERTGAATDDNLHQTGPPTDDALFRIQRSAYASFTLAAGALRVGKYVASNIYAGDPKIPNRLTGRGGRRFIHADPHVRCVVGPPNRRLGHWSILEVLTLENLIPARQAVAL